MTGEKLIRDVKGSPVPQFYSEDLGDYAVKTVDGSTVTRGDVDFSRTKLLRDKLGSPIPQLWDSVNHKWVVDTGQGFSGGGDGGPVSWNIVQDKPSEFKPSKHEHEISDINGLEKELEKVFTQVSSGKSLLETAIVSKGASVNKAGELASFQELRTGIMAIEGGGSTCNAGVPIGPSMEEFVSYSPIKVTEDIAIKLEVVA
ncbi:hypothetical protein [Psychrobacillus sp. FSL K6-2843]|jgi:hypothetical protein|uniref:hypothetical protein n=1 Tax=Psychrobacillus sp. FSL K6-2843 TaxID=2921549 RepID=UPI00315A5121